MVPRITGSLLLFLLSVIAGAQGKTLSIKFPSEGAREVWIQKGPVPTETKGHQSVAGVGIDIPVPEETSGMIVCVADSVAGVVGTVSLDDVLKSGVWTFDPKVAKHADAVAFLLQHDEKAVASAVVRLATVGSTRETLVTPTEKGLATFAFVPLGDVSVSVDYKSGGEDKSLPKQTFAVKAGNRAKPHVLKIDDEVETISSEVVAAASVEPDKKVEERAPSSTPNSILSLILGVVIVGGIGYAIYRFVTQNPEKTAAALGRAGVPMGDPNDPNVGQAKPSGPPKQIILDDAAPVTSAVAPVGASLVKNPRLVKADGSLVLLMDGVQTVGREATADHPHAGESSMSRVHATLNRVGDSVTLTDSGSTNGTFVNGRRIAEATVLSPGDTVQFGAVQYRYEE